MGLGFDLKKMKDKLDADEKKFGGSNSGEFPKYDSFRPEVGSNVLRIIPRGNDKLPYVKVGFHYQVFGSAFLCRRITLEESCPLCDLVDDLAATGNEKDIKTAKSISASLKAAWIVIDRKEETMIKDSDTLPSPKIWYASKTVSQRLMTFLSNPEKYGDLIDLKKGHDIELTMIKKGNRTSYEVSPLIPETRLLQYDKLNKKNLDALVEKMPPLDFTPMSEEELKTLSTKYYNAMDGNGDQKEDENDIDEPHPSTKKGSSESDDDRELEQGFIEDSKAKEKERKSQKKEDDDLDDDLDEDLDDDLDEDLDDEMEKILTGD